MAKRVKLDICRFRTERFREMPLSRVDRAYWRLMRGESTKGRMAQWGTGSARGLVFNFVGELAALKRDAAKLARGAYDAKGVRERAQAAIARRAEFVDGLERKIWDMQTKRRCRIPDAELVARDAIRQGGISSEMIDRLRGKRRPKIR